MTPRLLNQKTAAAYCGMSVPVFVRACPVDRRRVHPGPRGLRYDTRELDKWIDALPNDSVVGRKIDVAGLERWLERLDGPRQNPRR